MRAERRTEREKPAWMDAAGRKRTPKDPLVAKCLRNFICKSINKLLLQVWYTPLFLLPPHEILSNIYTIDSHGFQGELKKSFGLPLVGSREAEDGVSELHITSQNSFTKIKTDLTVELLTEYKVFFNFQKKNIVLKSMSFYNQENPNK